MKVNYIALTGEALHVLLHNCCSKSNIDFVMLKYKLMIKRIGHMHMNPSFSHSEGVPSYN